MYRQWIRKNNSGFTLIEVLFSLSISMIILLNCSLIIKSIKPFDQQYTLDHSLQNSIATLSFELNCAHQVSYGQQLTFYNEDNEKNQVILDNEQLVITPGYNILCDKIEQVYFYNKDGLIYLDCIYQNQNYTFFIGSDYENKTEG